jgi:predicted MPP superfamily phosphohydrolase
MLLFRLAPRSIAAPVSWVVYSWMGFAFFTLVLLFAGDIAKAVLALRHAHDPLDPERRRFLARAIGATVGIGATGISAAGLLAALRPVAVRTVRVGIGRLPEHLAGYKIVQLTDIHVGPTIGRSFIEDMVARTNALEPDLVAITGDLVDGSVEQLGHLVEPLRNLRARDGVFFVTGNHEYYSGADEWLEHLRTLGVRPLRNERVAIRGADGFDLGGVDDWTAHQFGDGHGMDMANVVAGRDASRAFVLLAHQPKAIDAAEAAGVDLQLSGHTHGGQMFPFTYLVRFQQPYVAGLHKQGNTQIYVSRGTGYWGPPMRIAAPAEITRIELYPT